MFSKFEETMYVSVKELAYMTDRTFCIKQIIYMEHVVGKVLAFSMAVVTINSFSDMYAVLLELPEKIRYLAKVRETIRFIL